MIIQYYNGYMNIEKIRDLLKINKNGTTAFHIVEGAKKIGFEASGIKCNLDAINEDNLILPCIANVIINNTYKHFVVIYKVDYERKRILIADPSNKIMYMSFDIFKSIFSGVLIMLYPKEDIPCEPCQNLKTKLLIHIVKSHPKLVKQIIILSSFVTVFAIISSFFLENLSNVIEKYNNERIVLLVLIIFLVIAFLKNITDYFRGKILILINEKINLELMLDTFKKILLLPYNSYRNKTTGDIVMRLLDVNIVKDTISKIFLTIVIDLPLSLCACFILIVINMKLFLLAIVILVLYVIIILLFKDYFDENNRLLKKYSVDATNYMIESINNFETIKGLKLYEQIYHSFEKKFVSLLKKTFSYNNIDYLQKLFKDIVSDCGLIVIYGLGAILVLNGQLTFASLLTFVSLLNYFYEPIKNIFNLEKLIRELNLILTRLDELPYIENKQGISNNVYLGDIDIKKLNYTYDERTTILNNIDLKILSGEKVIILGESGSGKSTLVKILMKYYHVSRGQVYINNIDINDYADSVGICYVSQSENLFTDSLYNNLTIFKNINPKKVLEISNLCYVDEIVKNNSLGFNMYIEENGFNLSGGERQRIVLARTLLTKFNILIIDEGMNQLDVSLERKILKNIFDKYKNKTIIVISHRLENLDLFDRKIVITKGSLNENISKI